MNKNISVILLIIFCARLYLIPTDLPRTFCYDENNYIEQALHFSKGLSMWNYSHGQLYQIVLFLAFLFYFGILKLLGIFHNPIDLWHSYLVDPTTLFMIARFIIALFSIGVSYLTYRIGQIYNVGLKSMLVVSFLLPMVAMSSLALADIMAVFLFLLSFFMCLNKRYYWAFFVIGLAIATKYHTIFGIIPLLIASPKRFRGIGLTILGFIIGMPVIFTHLPQIYQDTFVKMGGEYIVNAPRIWFLPMHLLNIFGGLFVFILCGVFYSAIKRTKKEDILCLSMILSFLAFFSMSSGYAHHFLPIIPLMVILAFRYINEFSIRVKTIIFVLILIFCLLDAVRFVVIMKSHDTRATPIPKTDASDIIAEGYIDRTPAHCPIMPEGTIKTSSIYLENLNHKYVLLTSHNDNWDEMSYYGTDFFPTRHKMKEKLAQTYFLYAEITPTIELSQTFPILMNRDFYTIRGYNFNQIIRGPKIEIYRRKEK